MLGTNITFIIILDIYNMAILDLFKEIPLSAILKEKLTDLEKDNIALRNRVTELESEVLSLNQSMTNHQEHRRTLENQIIEKETKLNDWFGIRVVTLNNYL